VKTMNVVRRDSLFGELKALGADAASSTARTSPTCQGAHARGADRLGLDAVSGSGDGAALGVRRRRARGVQLRLDERRGPVMSANALISGGQTLVGFILGRALAPSLEQIRAIYATSASRSRRRPVGRRWRTVYQSRTSGKRWRTRSA